MASSSATAAPSSGLPAITISLSSNDASDRRTIELAAGQVCIIGRASKSDFKNMRSTPNNALFDCPVVSRTHAELRASPWQPPGRQVTIIDKHSLHGTTVNDTRLQPNVPFTLKSGDVIKLGATVSRQNEKHEGVALTFKRLDDMQADSRSTRQPPTTRGFHAPLESDHSDFESDVESVSDYYGHSSAKTTPEQSKMKPGSQEQPIDIDGTSTAPKNKVINLIDDDDDEDIPALTNVPQSTHRSVIPESIDRDSWLVEERSVGEFAPAFPPRPVLEDEESVVLENTGLSQILNEARDVSDNEEEHQDSEVDDDDFEYDPDDMAIGELSEADYDLDSDVPHLSEVDDSDESELELDEEPLHREPSPELGDMDEPVNERIKPFNLVPSSESYSGFATKKDTASRPPYDPVRGSQPPADAADVYLKSLIEPQASTRKPTFSYAQLRSSANGSMYPATDFSASSRWDIPPVNESAMMHASSFGHLHPFSINSYSQSSFPAPSPPVAEYAPHLESPTGSFELYTAPENFHYSPVAPIATPSRSAKGKISIGNLVEDPVVPVPTVPELAQQKTIDDFFASGEVTASVAQADLPLPPSTGSKRKADQMEAAEGSETVSKKLATVDAATGPRSDSTASQGSRKKQKRSTIRTVAVEAAKLVGYSSIGVAGCAAFLMSPYAQQVIDYLG